MIYSEIFFTILKFFKKYWKEILIIGTIIVVGIYIWSLRTSNFKLKEEKAELFKTISIMEEVVRSREEVIKIQNKSMKIFEEFVNREKESEIQYKETITNNKEVIKEYINSERSKEDLEKLYQYENKQWNEIKESINKKSPVVEYNLNWWVAK